MNRRNFLRLGALFVPVVAAPTVAYSFCGGWAIPPGSVTSDRTFTLTTRFGPFTIDGVTVSPGDVLTFVGRDGRWERITVTTPKQTKFDLLPEAAAVLK